VTTDSSGWTFDQDRLTEALERWRRKHPNHRARRCLNEYLMDLLQDPFEHGQEDRETGVWTGLPGLGIVVVYVPDLPSRRVAVADINFG